MKKLNLLLKALLSLSFLFFLVTCNVTSEGSLHEVNTPIFAEEYWGEWIRMDNGDSWYFAGKYRKVVSSNGNANYYAQPVNMVRQSPNVVKVTEGTGASLKEYYLYASRIRNSTFEATVVSDDGAPRSLLFGSGRGGARSNHRSSENTKITFANLENLFDEQDVELGDDSIAHPENIIAGDNYIVTIDGYKFTVTPNTDGDNVGTLTLTNGVNIKTSIVPQSNSTNSIDLMRLYSGDNWPLTIKFSNVGESKATAMSYTLVMPTGLTITANDNSPLRFYDGELQTIEPGKTREINITVACASNAVTDDYELKEIKINTEDFYHKKWDDSVSLRVNKAKVTFNVRSNLAMNGVVIVPNGKSYHFTTSSNGYSSGIFGATIVVPKYIYDQINDKNNYLIVFSGATAETEPKYSFNVGSTSPGTNFANYPLNTLNLYWPNGTEGEATPVTANQEIRAYLVESSINYYKVRFTD